MFDCGTLLSGFLHEPKKGIRKRWPSSNPAHSNQQHHIKTQNYNFNFWELEDLVWYGDCLAMVGPAPLIISSQTIITIAVAHKQFFALCKVGPIGSLFIAWKELIEAKTSKPKPGLPPSCFLSCSTSWKYARVLALATFRSGEKSLGRI